ncbi:MAG: phosphoribosylanthranilate isomerase [Verrucomicrobiota bacterium]
MKICGLRSAEQVAMICEAGGDAVGINFWPNSKRYLSPGEAELWLGEFAGAICRVGLFVDASHEEVERVVDLGVLDALQFHGDESAQFVEEAAGFGLPILRAIGVGETGLIRPVEEAGTDYLLLDAFAPEEKGGTGRTFRWDLFRKAVEDHPEQTFFLAGGLTPENVGRAIREAQPHAVDTASGVESAPGVKDEALVRDFMAAVREAVES